MNELFTEDFCRSSLVIPHPQTGWHNAYVMYGIAGYYGSELTGEINDEFWLRIEQSLGMSMTCWTDFVDGISRERLL